MFRRRIGTRGLQRKSPGRRFSFERLESRELLAVTTSLANGDLTITGDAANDDIAIVGTANAGELTITGRNGTLVNGTPDGSVTIPGVARHLIINLNGGDDRVSLDNTFIAGNIEIRTGDGNDVVVTGEFNPVSPAGDLRIETGGGDDLIQEGITIYNTFVVGNNVVISGDGNDSVSLYGASALGQISIFGGTGADSILLNGVTGGSTMSLNGETGANSMAVLYSSARTSLRMVAEYTTNPLSEPPRNTFYVDTVFTSQLHMGTANGLVNDPGGPRDTFVTVASSIAHTLSVSTGDGTSHIVLRANTYQGSTPLPTPEGVPGPQLAIGGRGSNDISVEYNFFPINIDFSAGQHNLAVIGNVGDYGIFDGEQGPSYLLLSGNRFGSVRVTNFIQ